MLKINEGHSALSFGCGMLLFLEQAEQVIFLLSGKITSLYHKEKAKSRVLPSKKTDFELFCGIIP